MTTMTAADEKRNSIALPAPGVTMAAGPRGRARWMPLLLLTGLPISRADAMPDPLAILTGEANERARREAEAQGRDNWLQFDLGVDPSAAGGKPILVAHARGKRYDALRSGLLLVATPKEGADAYFDRTVLLITRHEPDAGTHALILNKPARRSKSAMLDELEEMLGVRPDNPRLELLDGGPVPTSMPSYAYPASAAAAGQRCAALAPPTSPESAVGAGVHLAPIEEVRIGTIPDAFLRCLVSETTVPVKLFFGISGWAPLQLDGEYRRGDWCEPRRRQRMRRPLQRIRDVAHGPTTSSQLTNGSPAYHACARRLPRPLAQDPVPRHGGLCHDARGRRRMVRAGLFRARSRTLLGCRARGVHGMRPLCVITGGRGGGGGGEGRAATRSADPLVFVVPDTARSR